MPKTPISYYGGKQRLASLITSLLPPHTLYAEPFVGGAAIFFAKPPSDIEVINDTNRLLINFYRVVQNQFPAISKMVANTLHSRVTHERAHLICDHPQHFTEVETAWAVWVLCTQSFSSMMDGNWGYDVGKQHTTKKIVNKKLEFTTALTERLRNTQVECTDALRIIKSGDRSASLFYCDPPYYNSNCGHYDGYSIEDYTALLEVLAGIQGKFLLSSYPSPILAQYVKQHGWQQLTMDSNVSVNKGCTGKVKTEVLTANYPIKHPLKSK